MPPLSYRPVLSPFAADLRVGAKNRPDQVKRLNDALYSVGHGDREVAEAPLDQQVLDGKAANQLTQFQKNMGLEPDGWVAPKGPTYKALNMLSAGAITGAVPNGKDQSDWLKSNFGLAGLVGQPPANGGNAGPLFNRPDDRLKVTNALGLYLPGKKLGLSQLDQPLSGEALGKALGDYEKSHQLPITGQAAPGGKTWTHLLGKIGTWVKDLPFGDAKTYAELTTPDPDKLQRILAGVKAERAERKPQVQVLKFADGVAEEKEFQNLRRALAEGKLDPHKGSYSREEIAEATGELMGHSGAKVSGQLRTTQRQPPDEDREAQASTPAGPQVAQAEEQPVADETSLSTTGTAFVSRSLAPPKDWTKTAAFLSTISAPKDDGQDATLENLWALEETYGAKWRPTKDGKSLYLADLASGKSIRDQTGNLLMIPRQNVPTGTALELARAKYVRDRQVERGVDRADADFVHALRLTMLNEGGTERDQETGIVTAYKGIDQENFYNKFLDQVRSGDLRTPFSNWPDRVENLNRNQIQWIYRMRFFESPKLRDIAGIPGLTDKEPMLLAQIFDLGVNSGPETAIKKAEQATYEVLDDYYKNVAGTPAWRHPKVAKTGATDDGFISALTTATSAGLLGAINNRLVELRIKNYERLAKKPKNAKYLDGWLARARRYLVSS